MECADWQTYRSFYPPRAFPGPLTFTGRPKPGKDEQRAWTVYQTDDGVQFQQWVMVPTLHLVPEPTQKLVCTSDETNLWASRTPCERFWREHCTNIHRIMELAERHPEVEFVAKDKESKKLRSSEFDQNGRAKRFHRSNFDLQLGLAATGAAMYVGVTVNGITGRNTERHPGGLIAFWWCAPVV